ncbi:peptidoglycan DD-metalloendopeptidase family protein [Altererythrobacter sp. GH1-8]|uniref:peptidoglycan DD-metalloendopeptidase family protein n=1 Tax=Altererythrobacter sp. GH1-8 TaxID=3349333 RepID=UPI00374D6455
MRSWFPDREFFMRSQGHVRFIKVSSRVQMAAAAVVCGLLIGWALSLGAMAWTKYQAEANRLSLLEREAKVATAEERRAAYGHDLEAVAEDLKRRQDFLEQMTEALPVDALEQGTVTDSSGEAAKMIEKVSSSFPEAVGLATIEAKQLAYVERLTRFADQRSQRAAQGIKKLGLDPKAIVRRAERDAMGGPLELLSTSADGSIDPRFERLGLSLARMTALENGLEGLPQVMPTNGRQTSISSGFGPRRDPFTRRAAMHRGLDFKGPTGADIYAASKGVVSFVGRKAGYGKTVEIRHGNGVITRYAHMSRFHAKVGDQVSAGDLIGAIGSTGRSTGPHLHFEVRINDRAVNPRFFLETVPDVLEEVRRPSEVASR